MAAQPRPRPPRRGARQARAEKGATRRTRQTPLAAARLAQRRRRRHALPQPMRLGEGRAMPGSAWHHWRKASACAAVICRSATRCTHSRAMRSISEPGGRQTGHAWSTSHPCRAEIVRRLQFAADHARRNAEMAGCVLQGISCTRTAIRISRRRAGMASITLDRASSSARPIAWRAGPGFWSTSSSTSRSSSVPLRWRCSNGYGPRRRSTPSA